MFQYAVDPTVLKMVVEKFVLSGDTLKSKPEPLRHSRAFWVSDTALKPYSVETHLLEAVRNERVNTVSHNSFPLERLRKPVANAGFSMHGDDAVESAGADEHLAKIDAEVKSFAALCLNHSLFNILPRGLGAGLRFHPREPRSQISSVLIHKRIERLCLIRLDEAKQDILANR